MVEERKDEQEQSKEEELRKQMRELKLREEEVQLNMEQSLCFFFVKTKWFKCFFCLSVRQLI